MPYRSFNLIAHRFYLYLVRVNMHDRVKAVILSEYSNPALTYDSVMMERRCGSKIASIRHQCYINLKRASLIS